jgi:hypothetical protein
MIVGDRSTLSIYSHARTAAEITAILGLQPSESAEKGEPKRAALAGRQLAPRHMTYERSQWSFDAEKSAADPDDETGFASLRVLVDVFRDKGQLLESLRADCETIVWWSGDSDSSQGGFVLPADLLADLARLGCDLYGTAFLGEANGES